MKQQIKFKKIGKGQYRQEINGKQVELLITILGNWECSVFDGEDCEVEYFDTKREAVEYCKHYV